MNDDERTPVDQIVWLLAVIGLLTVFVLVGSWLIDHGIQ